MVATLASYLSFEAFLALGLHYLVAGFGSWFCGVLTGFAMNRRFTFRLKSRAGSASQFGLFMVGAGLQLVLALAAYVVLIGKLGLAPRLAFCANLLLTTAFSYTFMSLVTFRNADCRQP